MKTLSTKLPFSRCAGYGYPMIDVLRIAVTKDDLLKMTAEERSLFLLLGYASNQVNPLWKLIRIN